MVIGIEGGTPWTSTEIGPGAVGKWVTATRELMCGDEGGYGRGNARPAGDERG